MVRAAEHGVSLDYVRSMASLGYRVGTLDALVLLRDHGVDPDYVRGMAAHGFSHLASDELVRARDHGVDPEYVKGMRDLGHGQTDLAPNAQFYIGETYYSQQKYDEAIQAFDSVLEKYPEGTKTLDAMYMKGMALARKGDRTAATAEFRALVKQAPTSEQASKARDQLKRLTAAPAPAPKKR